MTICIDDEFVIFGVLEDWGGTMRLLYWICAYGLVIVSAGGGMLSSKPPRKFSNSMTCSIDVGRGTRVLSLCCGRWR